MRTKALLLSAALVAAGVATSMAQSNVYSLNIVGYVNVPVQKGKLYMLQNPLDTGTGNNITNVLIQPYTGTNGVPDPALDGGWDGSIVWEFTQAGGYTANPETYITGFGWFPAALNMNPGTGFFLLSQSNSTVTFTGSVVLGSTNTLIPGIQMVGSEYAAANGPGALGLNGHDGDIIFRWYGSGPPVGYTGGTQAFGTGVTYIAGYGWYDSDAPTSSNGGGGGGSTNGPTLNVGEAFFYLNTGATIPWAQNFTVN